MGSTVGDRYVSGTVTCNDGILEVRKVGFKPKRVVVTNIDTLAKMEWNQELAQTTQWYKTVAAGTRTLEVTDGIALLDGNSTQPPGFSVGNATDINDTTTETLKYEAWG